MLIAMAAYVAAVVMHVTGHGADPAASAPQLQEPQTPLPYDAIFLFGRARAFKDMATELVCKKSALQANYQTLSSRLNDAQRRLAAKFGGDLFLLRRPSDPPAPKTPTQCDDLRASITLSGFLNALDELDALAK